LTSCHRNQSPLGVAVITLCCIALVSCGKAKKTEADESAPEVTLTTVRKVKLAQELLVSGNLAALPNRDAKVAALVPGRIKSLLVVEGTRVAADQPIAELDSTSLREQLRQAEAAVTQAKANVENARLSAQRNEGLLQRGIAARKEVEDARTQLSVNEATLQQAEAGLAAARTQLSRTVIRAPFAGTVVKRFAGVGEQVDGSASQPIAEVADVDSLELLGTAPSSRLAEIHKGGEFDFQTDQVPDAQFQARVVAVLPAVDPGTNNGTVRIRLANPKHLLKFGMFVSINLPLRENKERLVVPRQAVYPDESGEPHVYKVSGDEAESAPVKLGIQTKDESEILSGVQEGDKVILVGGYGLPEKSKVRIRQ
jgi:RND family efflux transporter MFP subunit